MSEHIVVKINAAGLPRVVDSVVGMTFIVDSFSDTVDDRGKVAHVRDYRCGYPYQIWSIGPEGYEVVE